MSYSVILYLLHKLHDAIQRLRTYELLLQLALVANIEHFVLISVHAEKRKDDYWCSRFISIYLKQRLLETNIITNAYQI